MAQVPIGTAMVMDVNVTISQEEINNCTLMPLVSVNPKDTMTTTSILMPNLNGSRIILNGLRDSIQEVSPTNDDFFKSSFLKTLFCVIFGAILLNSNQILLNQLINHLKGSDFTDVYGKGQRPHSSIDIVILIS